MSYPPKGVCIFVRRIEEGVLYHQHEAVKVFMSKIEQEGKFYDLVFGLLKNKCSSELQKKIWKLIDRLPTSKDKISKLENCK